MLVKQIMTSPAICVDHKTPIEKVIDVMREEDLGFLPVTKNDILIGVVTDRDILLRKDKYTKHIDEVMSKENIHTIDANSTLEEAARIMSAYKVRRLVVVSDNLIKGVITSKDLLYQDDLLPYIKQTYLNVTY